MHIHIKTSYEDNLSTYPSDSDDSVVIAILDDTIVTAIVLDLTKDVALKLRSGLNTILDSTEVEVIQPNPG